MDRCIRMLPGPAMPEWPSASCRTLMGAGLPKKGQATADVLQPTFGKDTWRKLMRPALKIVDSLETNGCGDPDFRIGGGTVPMFRFDRRISKDIGILTHGARTLSYVPPRLNEVAERKSRGYEKQPNVVKLTCGTLLAG